MRVRVPPPAQNIIMSFLFYVAFSYSTTINFLIPLHQDIPFKYGSSLGLQLPLKQLQFLSINVDFGSIHASDIHKLFITSISPQFSLKKGNFATNMGPIFAHYSRYKSQGRERGILLGGGILFRFMPVELRENLYIQFSSNLNSFTSLKKSFNIIAIGLGITYEGIH